MNDYMSGDKYEDKSINSFVTTLEYDKNYSIGTLPARVFANLNLTTGHLSSKNSNPLVIDLSLFVILSVLYLPH